MQTRREHDIHEQHQPPRISIEDGEVILTTFAGSENLHADEARMLAAELLIAAGPGDFTVAEARAFANKLREAADQLDAFCVCGHPRASHEPRGGALACTAAGCACGPGCIHEGFVDAAEERGPFARGD